MNFTEVKNLRKSGSDKVADLDEIVRATGDALEALEVISETVSALRHVLSADKHFYEGDVSAVSKNYKPRVENVDDAEKRFCELMHVASRLRTFLK